MLLWLNGQIPTDTLQTLVESLPGRMALIIAEKEEQLNTNAHESGMRCSMLTYFWLYIVYLGAFCSFVCLF